MKFRLFGGADCPDTLLAQLAVVSSLSIAQCESLLDFVLESFESTEGRDAEEQRRELLKTLAETGLLVSTLQQKTDLAHALCAFHTLMGNAVRYELSSEVVGHELSMIGASPDLVELFKQQYIAHAASIRIALVLRTPKRGSRMVTEVTPVIRGETEQMIQLKLSNATHNMINVEMSALKARALLQELIEARSTMQ